MVIPTITADPQLKRLKERLAAEQGVVHVSGLWGSSAPMVVAMGASESNRPCLYITAHLEEADNARDDLELFLGRRCDLFPAWEALPGEGPASGEIQAERLRLCAKLHQTRCAPNGVEEPTIVVTPIQALMQPAPAAQALQRNTLHISIGDSKSSEKARTPDSLIAWAVERGFVRLDLVESPGDVAQRGDIVDLFALGETAPYRIQFFDDRVESIRKFDVSTQRSMESFTSISVSALPVEPHGVDEAVTNLFTYLPSNTLISLDGPSEIQEMGEALWARLGGSDRLFSATDVIAAANPFAQLHLSRFGPARTADEAAFDFRVTSSSRFEGGAADAIQELGNLGRDHEVHVVCDNEGERRRLSEMIAEQIPDVAKSIHLTVGLMHRGFIWTASKTVVVAHHEVFHRHRQRRRIRRLHAGRPIESWTDLKTGDLVVHVVHGIAVYRGLKKMRKGSSEQQDEFLSLEFADRAMIHVPCSQVDLVQKYIGAGQRRPQLSKLGGKRWSKIKQQVGEAVTDLAEMLLRVQATRREASGTTYPPDTEWQREFEAAFLYEETEDQLLVAGEIRDDLTRPQPMDRLVCGDVGYGKTELAMRAAFKVVEYGRQVALLVPTTVLAEQHAQTFIERMAEYPFNIGCLSRFRRVAQQRRLIEQAGKGQMDILIGTHRLLSKDVRFANLGLVIIDEEQRFGVEHKERLKALRETVDVLTLSATPIPRTLHMSLVGIRDISSLQTPPVDRRAINTEVRPFDKRLIRDAILRELNRDGQIYFVHNYVRSIAGMAETLQQLVPEARMVFAHGQMKDDELEAMMHRFVTREADVLVSTTIIESGIDIPTVNTVFINRADRFGLADLHQLRGRVGRSTHRAYCYLLLSPNRPPTSKAAKRLKTIEEFSELGSGFRIAMRDLEIRGAGNLLGAEQSGHIAAVGYEMYCRLLDQSVRRLKNEPDPTPPPVQVDLDVPAHIPRHYISAERARIEIYRRIVTCLTTSDLEQLEKDLVDAFGPFPKQVQRLLELAEIRVNARRFGISSISLMPPDVVFITDELPATEPVFMDAPGTVRMPDARTIHLRLPQNYLEPATLIPVLRRMFSRANTKVEATT
ncbi:MAG: transcription-repair coupling factor [Planctomycetota bacterium]|jgi:transcription-repair coupling factor (superfamily II helicase)